LNIFENVIYSYDGKIESSALLLQSSVSHDLSEIILICEFAAQETFIIIIYLLLCRKQLCMLQFLWKPYSIFFRIIWEMENPKQQHLF